MRDWQPVLGLPLWVWLFVLPVVLVVVCWAIRPRAILRPIWRVLDKAYFAGGIVAAFFMVLILVLIVAQMVARWSGVTFPGSTEYAGYAMAGASFFALAHALTYGAHIRVSIFLNMNSFLQRWLNAFAMLIAAVTATYFARYAIKTNFFSEMLNDRTQGNDQVPEWLLTGVAMLGTWPWKWSDLWADTKAEWVFTPIWLPQITMSVGTVLLAVALWDYLIRLMVEDHRIEGEGVE
ncbi:MAG: TRAP transporter small permease subunit [Pseudomonadota bacterium]